MHRSMVSISMIDKTFGVGDFSPEYGTAETIGGFCNLASFCRHIKGGAEASDSEIKDTYDRKTHRF